MAKWEAHKRSTANHQLGPHLVVGSRVTADWQYVFFFLALNVCSCFFVLFSVYTLCTYALMGIAWRGVCVCVCVCVCMLHGDMAVSQ